MTLKVDHKEKFSGGPLLGHVGPTIIYTHSSFRVELGNGLGPSNSMAKWVLTIDLDTFFSIGPYFVCNLLIFIIYIF
jgi:hypothetical protein